ncbi:hypothetical protein V8C86DRAFT_2771138 [Haematococcus lacustris]
MGLAYTVGAQGEHSCSPADPPGCSPAAPPGCTPCNPPGCRTAAPLGCTPCNPPGCRTAAPPGCTTCNPPGCSPAAPPGCNPAAPPSTCTPPPARGCCSTCCLALLVGACGGRLRASPLTLCCRRLGELLATLPTCFAALVMVLACAPFVPLPDGDATSFGVGGSVQGLSCRHLAAS